ncbi:glycoprotease family-domain-containing protein [Terfezia claveryi]|nr:glycoprotease family-domain-containing protein [Terfezia claveryi]
MNLQYRHLARRFALTSPCPANQHFGLGAIQRRNIVVLGIETSCDDTSVALLDRETSPSDHPKTSLIFHQTITSNNLPTRGIHPLTSLSSHRTHLGPLIGKALTHLPPGTCRPDLVAATRGPGMRASLATGLDVAKGLAVAWGVPLIGVNHMLGHALTVRLVSALAEGGLVEPKFPFWSLLVSGGHTLVVRSEEVMEHRVLCETVDLAVGDMLDKVARCVVPERMIPTVEEGKGIGVVYGRVLEEYAFPKGDRVISYEGFDYDYHPPGTEARAMQDRDFREKYPAWSPLPVPFMSTGNKHHILAFSFSGIGSFVEKALKSNIDMSDEERRALGRQAMQCAFEHLAKRVVLALREWEKKQPLDDTGSLPPSGEETLVLSGGVASNSFLRHLLKKYLQNEAVKAKLVCPPPSYCMDNAAMIAWAGLEIWEGGVGVEGEERYCGKEGERGWATGLGCHPVRKWSLDSGDLAVEVPQGDPGEAEARGMLGVDCLVRRRDWIGRGGI